MTLYTLILEATLYTGRLGSPPTPKGMPAKVFPVGPGAHGDDITGRAPRAGEKGKPPKVSRYFQARGHIESPAPCMLAAKRILPIGPARTRSGRGGSRAERTSRATRGC
jgi:hypothetical protein